MRVGTPRIIDSMEKPGSHRDQSLLPRSAKPRAVLEALAAYIHAHCAETLRLDVLADMAGLSVSRFATVFRSQFGKPPHRYLTETRIECAKALLAQGSSVAAAASAAGFYDQSHLARHFKRVVGLTPEQFRDRMRDGDPQPRASGGRQHVLRTGENRPPWRTPLSGYRLGER